MVQKKHQQLDEELTAAHTSYHKSLNSYAYFKVHDKDLGEDLVQETFTKTWAYLVRGGKIMMMRAFLYHILNNLVVDEYRRRKHTVTSLDTLIENGYEPNDDSSSRLPDFLDGKAAILLIKRLPEKYQRVMQMRFIQLLSLKEISLIIGQSKNAVAVQIHRGMAKLRLLYRDRPQ